MKKLAQSLDSGLGSSAGRERTVEAHSAEARLDVLKPLLSDDYISAYYKGNTLKTCLVALLAKSAAVELALTVERGNDYRIGIRLDSCGNILLLSNHNSKVNDLKACLSKSMVKDLVTDRVNVSTDNAYYQYLFLLSLHDKYLIFH